MFKINLDICEYKPYLQPAIPQLLKSTETVIRSLFTDLMVVKNHTFIYLFNNFSYANQTNYLLFLDNAIAKNIQQYGNPLNLTGSKLISHISIKNNYQFEVHWLLQYTDVHSYDLRIHYNIVADDTPTSNRIITLNDVKW